ncbi:MAG TPA: hypothetical protein PLO32_08710 [Chitinophagales bacterium]|nr:hypothetical protein [Chitinophagales bacterium]
MNHQLFSKSDLHGRAAIVFCDGDYISSIKEYAFKISLFIVDDTYVEVFYNAYTNKLEDIAIMEPDESRLQKYATGVDITDLFK